MSDVQHQSGADRIRALEDAVGTCIVGQDRVIRESVACLLAGGHALLEGAPGLGKTQLVKSLSAATGLGWSRIQFTPDLLPSDITGTEILREAEAGRTFVFQEGPLFGHIVLADEINRATPRTQSALIEAMAEGHVSVAGQARDLPQPFVVLATQNPIEMEGTFPLPEAQLDRFLMKVRVPAPDEAALVQILGRADQARPPLPEAVTDREGILALIRMARSVAMAEPLLRQVARIVRATHPESAAATDSARRHIRLGASPRAGEALCRVARVAALRDGRGHVTLADIAWALPGTLRHRLLPSFEAEARGLTEDALVADVLHDLPDLPKEVEDILAVVDRS